MRGLSYLGVLSLVALLFFVPAADAQANQRIVFISSMAFSPAQLDVESGTTIVWSNQDNLPHTVTADDGTFDSGALFSGETYSFTFQSPGRITYHCSIHPFMTASVAVSDGGGDATAPTDTSAATKAATTGAPSLILAAVAFVSGAGVLGWAVLGRRS
jgi:plastocyanin